MASILGKIVADFSTSLATKVAVGGTSATLQSAIDDDGVALPTGAYFLTVDGNSSQKEYWACDLNGTALSNIENITRQGTQSSGSAREHRIGASVKITNFAHIKYINDLLNGDATIDANLVFNNNSLTGLATPTSGETTKAANVAYVNSVAIAGVSDAADAVKGAVEIATQAEVDAGDDTGSTTAPVVVIPSRLANVIQDASYVYAADAQASDTYVITLTPALTAYAAGQSFYFKANTANTGAATLNVNGLGAKNILKYNDQTLETGDIEAGKIVHVIYDGTSMQLQSPVDSSLSTANTTLVATNIGTLTSGATSDAAALHTHTGINKVYVVENLDVNGNTETTLFTQAIPAGSFTASGLIEVHIPVIVSKNNTGTIDILLKWGGTTLSTNTLTVTSGTNGKTAIGEYVAYIVNNGATNSQNWSTFIPLTIESGSDFILKGEMETGTSAIDSSIQQTLEVTATPSSANMNFLVKHGYVKVTR